jgi:hypothetical protein
MGEIADDMLEGLSCAECGVYFEDAHGYPVLCTSCWNHLSRRERQQSGLQKAFIPEMGEDAAS